jgi:hypothetical protein
MERKILWIVCQVENYESSPHILVLGSGALTPLSFFLLYKFLLYKALGNKSATGKMPIKNQYPVCSRHQFRLYFFILR